MIIKNLEKYKYELLLLALVQHLFIGIFVSDLEFYTRIIWPINMILLGLGSVYVFSGKSKIKHIIKNVLFFIVIALPIGLPFFGKSLNYFLALNILYVLFFIFIFLEILKHLLKPSYINADIISASACGYLLLIEISVFLLQFFQYQNMESFKGIDTSLPSTIFIDLVYFCSITFTSIGFGDITPNTHITKLLTSFIGITGQFYSVVLVGILISKFSSQSENK